MLQLQTVGSQHERDNQQPTSEPLGDRRSARSIATAASRPSPALAHTGHILILTSVLQHPSSLATPFTLLLPTVQSSHLSDSSIQTFETWSFDQSSALDIHHPYRHSASDHLKLVSVAHTNPSLVGFWLNTLLNNPHPSARVSQPRFLTYTAFCIFALSFTSCCLHRRRGPVRAPAARK